MKLILAFCLVVGFVIDEAYQCPPVGYSGSTKNPAVYYYCQLTRPPNTYMMYAFTCKTGLWDQALQRCNTQLTTLGTTTTSTSSSTSTSPSTSTSLSTSTSSSTSTTPSSPSTSTTTTTSSTPSTTPTTTSITASTTSTTTSTTPTNIAIK